MKVTIQLRYHTHFGQTLFLCGEHPLLGGGQPERALPLRYVNEEFWEVALDLPETPRPEEPVSYYFLMRDPDASVTEDFGGDRKLDLATLGRGHNLVIDSWNDLGTVENIFSTEPFKKVLLPAAEESVRVNPPVSATHSFRVKAPLLPKGQTICLLGNIPALGGWNQAEPVLLRRSGENGGFSVQLVLAKESFPIAYKYGVYDLERNAFVRYEDGSNRVLSEAAAPGGQVIVNDGFARVPRALWRGAGVSIPVFSLRSERSFGVGEFLDLPLLADWARRAGLKLIQILPVNDTSASHTWMDSYPYAAISAFALHPLYLNLDRVAGSDNASLLESLAGQRQQLNALATVDYEAVMKAKLAFVRKIFPAQRENILASADYRKFCEENEHWLAPYAAFCFLRDKFGTADFNQWPQHRVYDAAKIRALAAGDAAAREEIDFHSFIQYHLHLQLREAADQVQAHGLILKGDIAIGVSPHSADVWQQPERFHTDMQAGAPPDPFAAKGQNWGFPTYNWPRMRQDGFDWWKRRLAQMSFYFDAFRVDHILGFFRIWSIPRHAVEGILGYFVPAIPVQVGEFAARGILFDYERFARPFINDAVLREVFGERAEIVRRQFLDPALRGTYSLKPEFATQRDVAKYFASLPEQKRDERLQVGLFDLISNVLLIDVPGSAGAQFHFRLGIEQTASFRQLDQATQARLRDLCVDYFFRRQDDFWRREALQKLPALKRVTNMLICGEDLGMVPACVPEVMKQLGLLSLEIQRMPKAMNMDFSRPADAPYLSVVTPATHDMSTLRGWWLEDKNRTQIFFNQELRQAGPAPTECEPWISREIVRQHLDSPAVWSIFQLQDLLGMDAALRRPDVDAERINVPGVTNFYWRYRMHISLEALGDEEGFTRLVENLIRQCGR
ncbi:MAG TPA: 4-alpha-glucanotransferase [Verrucomicrobiae bacterium]|jgi:4-alpha-glucanotransferase|nr:4-alpha-glucanotransferase [Verrucomicrobiae bacterium]